MNKKIYKKATFLKSSFLSMMEQGISSITSFLTSIVLARATNPIFSGYYTLILSVIMIILGLQRVIVAVPFNVLYPKIENSREKVKYRSSIVSIECLFLLISIIIIVLLAQFKLINIEINFLCLGIFVVGYLYKDFTRQYFFGLNKINLCFSMSITQSLLQIILLYMLHLNNIFNLDLMLLVIGCSCVGCSLIFSIKIININSSFSQITEIWKKNWWTAKWSVGISLSDSVKNQFSIWVLNFFISTSAVGVYNTNNTFAMLPQPVFNGLSQFLLPHFSELFADRDYVQIKSKSLITLAAVFLCNFSWMICLYLLGNYFITLLYGEEYVLFNSILILCSLRGMLTSISSIASAILQAIEQPQIILNSLIIGVLIVITLGVVLTRQYGIMGMCLSMCIMYGITTLIQIIYIIKILRKNIKGEERVCQ